MSGASTLASWFDVDIPADDLPPYFTLGARRPPVGTAALDSSDQHVLQFDEVTGVAACRTGLNAVGADNRVLRRDIGEIVYVFSNPTAPAEQQLRLKLA